MIANTKLKIIWFHSLETIINERRGEREREKKRENDNRNVYDRCLMSESNDTNNHSYNSVVINWKKDIILSFNEWRPWQW